MESPTLNLLSQTFLNFDKICRFADHEFVKFAIYKIYIQTLLILNFDKICIFRDHKLLKFTIYKI
jgi:hypothetical protein